MRFQPSKRLLGRCVLPLTLGFILPSYTLQCHSRAAEEVGMEAKTDNWGDLLEERRILRKKSAIYISHSTFYYNKLKSVILEINKKNSKCITSFPEK